MSEMVERVAKTIDRGAFITQCDDGTEEEACGCVECEVRRNDARINARAAIEAMREPTPHMVEVGWQLIRGNLRPDEIFPHMIDAALKD